MIVGSGNGTIPPVTVVLIQTGIFSIAAPIVLNNAIAGEREKRTWDLLLVAPVTKGQIMLGKFAGAMTNLLFGAILFLLPIFICAVSYSRTDFASLALAELNSITFAAFACSLSLFFSARCKRSFTALGMALGLLALGLVIYPILVESLSGLSGPMSDRDLLYLLHPMVAESRLMDNTWRDQPALAPMTVAITQCFVFAFLAVVGLVWTERTLTFSDNEVRFLPKKHA